MQQMKQTLLSSQVNKPDLSGWTPLMGAAHNGHERVLELLLEREDIDAGPNGEGETAFYLADVRGHAGAAELLRDSNMLTGMSSV